MTTPCGRLPSARTAAWWRQPPRTELRGCPKRGLAGTQISSPPGTIVCANDVGGEIARMLVSSWSSKMVPRFRLFRAFGDDFGLACACERLVLGVDALGPFTRPVRLGG